MNETKLQNNKADIQDSQSNSPSITMEMVSTGIVVHRDGSTTPVLMVHFETSDGLHLYYPWNELKETVLRWVQIENDGK